MQLTLQLGLQWILYRLLTPEDYGVQAMVFPIALLVQGVANSGLQSAIIQRDELDDVQASALFWASLQWNALLCGGMAVVGVGLVALYREPRVLAVTVAWAAITFFATLCAIQEALLKRQFRFGAVLGANLTGLAVSIVVAIVAARMGARYWAIILQLAVVEVLRVSIIWAISPWRPRSPKGLGDERHSAVAELRRYWRGFAGARFVQWIGDQADRLTVGAIGGAGLLGLYDFAKRWGTFAFLELYMALSDVAVASLSAVRKDTALFATYVRNAFLPVLVVSLPIIGFLFAEPRALVWILGEQWAPATRMLQALCVAIALGCIGRLAIWVSLATGETPRQFRLTLITTPAYLAGVFIGARWGGLGVAIGVAIANLVTSIPSVFYLLSTTSLEVPAVLRLYFAPLLATAGGVGVLLFAGGSLAPADSFAGLVVRGLAFVGVYAVLWLVIPGGLALLRGLLHRGSETRSA